MSVMTMARTQTSKKPRPFRALGEQLHRDRELREMSQHEAALAMGIHQTFLSHAELGYKRPHPDNLRVMARVLDGNFEQYSAPPFRLVVTDSRSGRNRS